MDNLLESLENYYNNCKKNDNSANVKSVYEELAEKEEALVLAANFGKTLLEEKEQLEVQLDALKKDYQNKIEILEQEKYGLKMLIEQIRNEYESKIYELSEDMHLMNKQIETQQNERNIKLNENNTYINIIQELTEKNQNLINELKISRDNYYGLEEKYQKLEADLEESEVKYSENIKLLNNYKKEISLQIQKQQEYEYLLMQTCNDRDHKCKLLEEANNKLAYYENEKQNLDQIVYEQERQIIDLQALNEELTIKLENINNNNANINQTNATTHRHKSINNYIHKLTSRNSTTFYDDEFDSYFDIFKLNDVSNINWQDECQINEQNQNSKQTNSSTTTTTNSTDDDDYNKENNKNSNNEIRNNDINCHKNIEENEIRDDSNDNSNNSINNNDNCNDMNSNSDKDQIDDNNTNKMNNEIINSSDYYESMY